MDLAKADADGQVRRVRHHRCGLCHLEGLPAADEQRACRWLQGRPGASQEQEPQAGLGDEDDTRGLHCQEQVLQAGSGGQQSVRVHRARRVHLSRHHQEIWLEFHVRRGRSRVHVASGMRGNSRQMGAGRACLRRETEQPGHRIEAEEKMDDWPCGCAREILKKAPLLRDKKKEHNRTRLSAVSALPDLYAVVVLRSDSVRTVRQ